MSATRRLKVARKRRNQIAQTLKALARGDTHVEDILEAPPSHLGAVRIHTLLECCPHLGEKGVEKILREAKVWPTTRMRNLTGSEYSRIVEHLPPRARSRRGSTNSKSE